MSPCRAHGVWLRDQEFTLSKLSTVDSGQKGTDNPGPNRIA
jgi:hypothetical protein